MKGWRGVRVVALGVVLTVVVVAVKGCMTEDVIPYVLSRFP